MSNKNPEIVATLFPFRVEVFFKDVILDGYPGKKKYYAIRVEL